jgi:tRNA(fMet)-specific endonuclease VapC
VKEKLDEVGIGNCAISEITLAELLYGAHCSQNPKKNKAIVESFVNDVKVLPILESLELYAKEKSRLKINGELISDFDLLIGSTSIQKKMTMVTENIKEFKRMQGIKIENWIVR